MHEFAAPSHLQRERIWHMHTSECGLPVSDAIDWEKISRKYDLSGGFIKNAVMSSLLMGMSVESHRHRLH